MDERTIIKDALIELYLGVKIRHKNDINNYDKDVLKREKRQLLEANTDELTIIEYINCSVDILINMNR